jgi:hypothetical protein
MSQNKKKQCLLCLRLVEMSGQNTDENNPLIINKTGCSILWSSKQTEIPINYLFVHVYKRYNVLPIQSISHTYGTHQHAHKVIKKYIISIQVVSLVLLSVHKFSPFVLLHWKTQKNCKNIENLVKFK